MSLDVDLMVTQPTSVFTQNITHNLNTMAAAVTLNNGKTLYDILWRPDEQGYKYAKDITEMLDEAHDILVSDPTKFKSFNPANGWGSYEGLVDFVYHYKNACKIHPEAELSVSR